LSEPDPRAITYTFAMQL